MKTLFFLFFLIPTVIYACPKTFKHHDMSSPYTLSWPEGKPVSKSSSDLFHSLPQEITLLIFENILKETPQASFSQQKGRLRLTCKAWMTLADALKDPKKGHYFVPLQDIPCFMGTPFFKETQTLVIQDNPSKTLFQNLKHKTLLYLCPCLFSDPKQDINFLVQKLLHAPHARALRRIDMCQNQRNTLNPEVERLIQSRNITLVPPQKRGEAPTYDEHVQGYGSLQSQNRGYGHGYRISMNVFHPGSMHSF